MKEMIRKFSVTFLSVLALVVIALLVVFDTNDASYVVVPNQLSEMPTSVIAEKKRRDEIIPECLMIVDERQIYTEAIREHFGQVLDQMRIGHQDWDISQGTLPDMTPYSTVIIMMFDMEPLVDILPPLNQWVKEGGRLMFSGTPENTPAFLLMAPALGIQDVRFDYRYVQGFTISESFMIGAENDFTYTWEPDPTEPEDQGSQIMDVTLEPDAKVYVWSADELETPIVWSREHGKGRVVMINHDYYDKTSRGMTCASYALLNDTCIYPVINASTFFIDDFPSPIPYGSSEYILRDYNTTIADFYNNIWWPDLLKMSNTYGTRYTGLLIEDYTDHVTGEFPRQTSTERFNHFGASLLNHGGEIGLHGYNHQPLAFTGFQFDEGIDYNTWTTEPDMKRAFDEMVAFAGELFPQATLTAYIPPSNILSPEGRAFLVKNYPQVDLISGLYAEDPFTYVQEFEVSDDGIIEFPRLTSGSILDNYSYFAQLNAMNMYYVVSHFIHPDDALDVDRGAELGWEQLYDNTKQFFQWIYSSAKGIRNLTASDGGRAIARYDALSLERTITEDAIKLRFGGFWDEAYLLMRFNEGAPGQITGGTVQHISGDFYLLHATESQVTIQKK